MTATPHAPAGPPAPVLPTPSIGRAERSLAPDIARGGMLLFISLANVPIHLWGIGSDRFGHLTGQSVADHVALFVEQLVIAERSRPMFAVLYGFGIAVMASRMFARGMELKGVRRVLRRRSWWLVAFGAAHAALLFYGDILAPYGATGLIALFLVHLSDRALKRWLWATGAFFVVAALPFLAWTQTDPSGPPTVAGASPYVSQLVMGLAATLTVTLAAVVFLMFVPLVIVGMMLRRAGWIDRPEEHLPQLKRVFASGMVVNVASSLPVALIALGAWEPSHAWHMVAVGSTMLGGMYAGLGYVCGFALLAHRLRGRGRSGVPGALAAVGERSLTSYLLQSIVMAPLLTAWGFGLGEDMGYLAAFGVASGTWLLTVLVAVLLEQAGRRGPFEVLLRRLSYGPRRS